MPQVISGLEYLHDLNIIHRDIKPDNILHDRATDVIKLCDFGAGLPFRDADDSVCKTEGTPVFTAPEACRGQYYAGKAADIWQLGITLYALAFGCVTFRAPNQVQPCPPVSTVAAAAAATPIQGCIRREGASEAAPQAVKQAVEGGCRRGWGRLLSVINALKLALAVRGGVPIGVLT